MLPSQSGYPSGSIIVLKPAMSAAWERKLVSHFEKAFSSDRVVVNCEKLYATVLLVSLSHRSPPLGATVLDTDHTSAFNLVSDVFTNKAVYTD